MEIWKQVADSRMWVILEATAWVQIISHFVLQW